MKRITFVICIFALLVSFASCSVKYHFSQDLSELDQIQIDIVKLETDMGYHAGSNYNEDNISVIKTIDNDKKAAFISDFKKIKCYEPNFGSRIDSIIGKAIRITYKNGDIELITSYGVAIVKGGQIRTETTTFDSDAFDKLLEEYS